MLSVTVLAVLDGLPLLASDPTQPSGQYLVTRFGADEGNPALIVHSIVQSRDGFLWIANGSTTLVRFDGRRFYEVPSIVANALAVTPDGDLWVLRLGGVLTRVPADGLARFGPLPTPQLLPNPNTVVRTLRVGRNGALWVGAQDGLYRVEHGVFSQIIPGLSVERIEQSANGHLHIIANGSYLEWDGSRTVSHPEIAQQLGIKPSQIFHVIEDSHGVMWYCTELGVARGISGSIERLVPFGMGHSAFRAYEDPRGVVWIASRDGLYRTTAQGLELVDPNIHARYLFGDRDGDLWIGTNGAGIIRLRERAIRLFTPTDGLPNKILMTVLASHDGSIWTGANCGGLSRFDGRSFRTYTEKDGLLNTCVYSIAEDQFHDLWLGTYGGGAFRFHDGVFTQFSKEQGMQSDAVISVLPARDGSVWFATGAGISRLVNGQIRNYKSASPRPRTTSTLKEDSTGAVWAGNSEGIERFSGDRFVWEATVPNDALPVGELMPGRMYFGAGVDHLLSIIDHHQAVTVVPLSARAAAADQNGDIWLGAVTIRRMPARMLRRPPGPSEPLEYTFFGREDGMPAAGCSDGFPCLAVGKDNKVWVATLEGLAVLDLDRVPKTDRQPVIYMGEITVGRNQQAPGKELSLPPGTHHVELQFNAIELVSHEKIRMQYRLDGVDSEWLDATPSGVAIYSNIPAGTHAFHVRSSNRDGIWDLKGIVYNVTEQPYFYETNLFRIALIGLLALLLAAAYRLRVRQIAVAMNARFDERLAERTRIARDFHDTLLQTIQGSKMVADDALEGDTDPVQMRQTMERLSGWLGQAIQEGREALSSLRSSTIERNDLAEALRRAGDECRLQRPIEFELSVEGSGSDMHPIARDEVYRIGYEAIRNACNHSGATRLEVDLSYVRDLVLRVRDNGRGFEHAGSEKAEGHFGLVGMYERAARIRGKLTISSSPGGGTEVELVVPRSVVFHESTGKLAFLRRIWKRPPPDAQRPSSPS